MPKSQRLVIKEVFNSSIHFSSSFFSEKHSLLIEKKMSVSPYLRECSWTDSGDSNISSDKENNLQNSFGIFPVPIPRSRARRGSIIPFYSEELEDSRMFWQQCLVGTLIDLRRFSVEIMQRLISRAWRLRDSIFVVRRDRSNYIIHFNNPDDCSFILVNGP